MANVIWHDNEQLEIVTSDNRAEVRSGNADSDEMPRFLSDPDVANVLEHVAIRSYTQKPSVRSGQTPTLRTTVQVEDGAEYMMILTSPSGAISFHDGERKAAGSNRRLARTNKSDKYDIEFNVPFPLTANEAARRGELRSFVGKIVKAIIVKVVDFVAEAAVDKAEAAIWRLLGRERGVYKIDCNGNELTLTSFRGNIKAGPNGRALILLHGTFSTTQGSFGSFANEAFFNELKDLYGSAIYGFEHFSVSVSPKENAKELLKRLPTSGVTCDVITHSRGGLVLRNLVERSEDLDNGDRFDLGRAVLVACPNEGTPLATPDRWSNTVGWFANILDLVPPNVVTTNGALLARWITWFVKFGVKAAEGLSAMDMAGKQIQRLQAPPAPERGKYSAIVTNYEPNTSVWARAVDLGVDWFFERANDLVVPTAGGYRIDRTLESIPASQIGVYGPGGNIPPDAGNPHHLDIVSYDQTRHFILNALQDKPQTIEAFDARMPLPNRRSAAMNASEFKQPLASGPPASSDLNVTEDEILDRLALYEEIASDPPSSLQVAPQPHSSVFELTVFDPKQVASFGLTAAQTDDDSAPFLYAAYGGARILVPFWFKKSHVPASTGNSVLDKRLKAMLAEMNDRRDGLFGYHRKVKKFLDGKEGAAPLTREEMQEFGHYLFKTLFPEEVKRLYDVARARERGNQDNMFLIFTSMIPWVFDMPWEFAVDHERGTQLAIEDVHFIRNILTQTPVDELKPKEQFTVLVVVAQPTDLVPVSSAEEIAKLSAALSDLQTSGLVEFHTLEHATPQSLHREIATGKYDVLHFIGHGYWDREHGDSGLVLENGHGGSHALGGSALREVISNRGLRLVFLNACDTGRSRRNDSEEGTSLAGVAQDLFGRGVPNIIANQYPVGDGIAVTFAKTVYEFLADGKTIAEAVREARIATKFETAQHAMDWAVPVVYARDPKDRLVIDKTDE